MNLYGSIVREPIDGGCIKFVVLQEGEREGLDTISFMMTCGFLYLSSQKLKPGLMV